MATMSTSSITFPVSDGDSSHRPPPNSRHIIATREAQANYRAKVGKGIAKDLEGYRPGNTLMRFSVVRFEANDCIQAWSTS